MAEIGKHLGHRAEGVYQSLLKSIRRGEYAPGDRLPGGRDLAREYRVSLGTVQKAIGRLAQENYVETVQGSGTHVHALCPDTPGLDIVSVMYPFDSESLVHVQKRVMESGCLLSTFSQIRAKWDPAAERQFLIRVKEQRHRALVAFCSPLEPLNADVLQELDVAGVRVVHLEHYGPEPPPQSYLIPDYRGAGYQAAVTLLLAGYGPVFVAGLGVTTAPYSTLTLAGIADALKHYGETFDAERMSLDLPPTQPGYDDLMRSLFSRVPPGGAVVAQTLMFGRLAAYYLREAGRRVPEEVGVFGIATATEEDPGAADGFVFRPRRVLDRALDEVMSPDWQGVRELVVPERVQHGTVRERLNGRGASSFAETAEDTAGAGRGPSGDSLAQADSCREKPQ